MKKSNNEKMKKDVSNTELNSQQNDEEKLASFTWEDKVGKKLYNENGPLDGVAVDQSNNRSVEQKKIISDYEGGPEQLGYKVSDNPREIVAVHKEEGNIAAVKLDDGTILSKAEAIELTKQGGIKDCNVGRRGSRETLRRNPVDDPSKSLSNLPRF